MYVLVCVFVFAIETLGIPSFSRVSYEHRSRFESVLVVPDVHSLSPYVGAGQRHEGLVVPSRFTRSRKAQAGYRQAAAYRPSGRKVETPRHQLAQGQGFLIPLLHTRSCAFAAFNAQGRVRGFQSPPHLLPPA